MCRLNYSGRLRAELEKTCKFARREAKAPRIEKKSDPEWISRISTIQLLLSLNQAAYPTKGPVPLKIS